MTTLLQEFEEYLRTERKERWNIDVQICLEQALEKLEELKKKHGIA